MTQASMDSGRDILAMPFENETDRQDLAAALEMLSRGEPLPDVPETREMVSRIFIQLYGDALRELAKR